MNWKTKHINLGVIKAHLKKEIIFVPEGNINDIVSMTSSCGCSVPKKIDGKVVVVYTPTSVPFHLQSKGEYKTTKNITVNYKDGTKDILSFTAIVKNKL